MLLKEVYYNTESILNKTNNGNVFGSKEFNYYLKSIIPNMLKKEVEDVELKYGSLSKGLYSSKLLREFRVTEQITPVAGNYTLTGLSNTYKYFISAITTSQNSGRYVEAIFVNDDQWSKINSNYIGKPGADYIICRIVGDTFEFRPTTTGEIDFTFIKAATIPYLDYYIDANDQIVFLDAGATGVSVPAGGTASDGTDGPTSVNSSTVEIPFSSDYHHTIMLEILKVMGVRIESGNIVNFSNQEQAKIDQV